MIHLTARVFQYISLLGCLTSSAYYLLCLWSAASFLRARKAGESVRSTHDLLPVSILKPLKGTDPEIYESFRSHCLQAAEHRGGMFTMSPDGRLVLGPVPDVPGLWVASGCNGCGFSSSLALGEALAQWIAGTPGEVAALGPGRFGPVTDEALISGALWQYEHYYDPAPAAA